jgi:hypothetical protein
LAAAYAAGNARLREQFNSLDELRTRVGTLLSAAAIGTGFLAGQSLNTANGVPFPAWIGIIGALLLVIVCAAILRPQEWQGERLMADKMVENARARPDETVDDFYATMAMFAAKHAQCNQPRIDYLYKLYTAGLVLLVIDFAGWIWTLAQN